MSDCNKFTHDILDAKIKEKRLHAFFISKTFISNIRLKIDKKQVATE